MQRQELDRNVREGPGRVPISLRSKNTQNQWRRALIEMKKKKKKDNKDEERHFIDQIKRIGDKVRVQSPQELCEVIL